MKGIICYFSTTGNTKLACKNLISKLDNIEFDLHDINKKKMVNFSNYDLVGFASYTDFLAPGKLMEEYIQGLKGDNTPTFVLNTFGQMSGNTQGILRDLVKKAGFKLVAGFAFHVPENFPPLIKNGTTNDHFPEQKDLDGFNAFAESLNEIVKLLIHNKEVKEIRIRKNVLISALVKFMNITNLDKMGTKSVHLETCISCSLCSKVCPYNVIEMVDGHPIFAEKDCKSCYSCFNHCPSEAIYTKKLDGVGHYSRPHKNFVEKLK